LSLTEFTKQSYDEVVEEYQAALSWLRDLGVRFVGGRHERYLSILEEVVLLWKKGETDLTNSNLTYEELATAFLEAAQLIRIWKGFRKARGEALGRRLREVVAGPVLPREERSDSSSNLPRNIALELDLASPIAATGGAVELADNTDIVFAHRGIQYFIECKRPATEKGIERGIRGAKRQLRSRLRGTRLIAHGLIGISVGQAFWPPGVVISVSDKQALDDTLEGWLGRFRRIYDPEWITDREGRIGGLLVQLTFVAAVRDGNPLNTGHIVAVLPRYPVGSREFNDLVMLRQQMLIGVVG